MEAYCCERQTQRRVVHSDGTYSLCASETIVTFLRRYRARTRFGLWFDSRSIHIIISIIKNKVGLCSSMYTVRLIADEFSLVAFIYRTRAIYSTIKCTIFWYAHLFAVTHGIGSCKISSVRFFDCSRRLRYSETEPTSRRCLNVPWFRPQNWF